MDRGKRVGAYFDQPDKFLRAKYYVELRAAIVRELCGEVRSARILDAGCGNGAISRQFYVRGRNHITLLDISAEMLARAKQGFASAEPADGHATFVLGDLPCLAPAPTFDYVLALGVLAHVEHPERFIAQLASLVKPDGRLLVQFTDYHSLSGAMLWHYQAIRDRLFGRRGYKMNKIKLRDVREQTRQYGLAPREMVRYSLTVPGMDRLIPDRMLFRYESIARANRLLRKFGSDCIVMFTKRSCHGQ